MHRIYIPLAMALLLAIPTMAAAAGSVRLPASGQTACFDSTGAERVCAGTGEDGEKQAGLAWPVPRFSTNNENGTVTDNLTGLTWSRHANAPDPNPAAPFVCQNAEGDMSWQQALDFIDCLNENDYGEFADWRLPNLNELESMVNAGAADPSGYLSAGGFGLEGLVTLVQPSAYWSSTSDASFTDSAWDLDFLKGDFPLSSTKVPELAGVDTRAVWPVRGLSTGPAAVTATGQSVCFSEAGAAVGCAGSGQDGERQAGVPWPAPRFKTHPGGGFALDRLTGLIWSTTGRTPGPAGAPPDGCATAGSQLDWQQALDHVGCLSRTSYLGAADWRLPNRKEMLSLADYSRSAPALPAGHPFADLSSGDIFWTSTSNADRPDEAWTVNLIDGGLAASGKSNGGILPAWPVSGPDLVAPALSISGGEVAVNLPSRTISGTVEAGAAVSVAVNGGAPAAAQVNGATWSYTVNPLAVGANTVTVTARDFSENDSVSAIGITLVVPDGKLAEGGEVTIADALLALRIVVKLVEPTPDQLLRADVAPQGAPDNEIGLEDTLLILRKAVHLESF